jgi:hypothetical protein
MRWIGVVVGLVLGGLTVACDDSSSTGETTDATVVPDDDTGPSIGEEQDAAEAAWDATPADAGPSEADGSAGGDAAAEPDAALPPECQRGERACLQDGEPARRVCGDNLRWRVDMCPDSYICTGDGRCLPDAATCRPGERTCLTRERPAECDADGGGWVPLDSCIGDEYCSGPGLCRPGGCLPAAARRSYLGCDFNAVPLPNLAWADGGGTPEAPLGVVVANLDDGESVEVTVRGSDGELADVLPEATVEAFAGVNVGMQYDPVTVRSELRTRDGIVLFDGFNRADRLEIPAGGMAVLLLDHFGIPQSSGIDPHAYRVTTDSPVAAYQFSPYCCNFSFTNDASLLLPEANLGTEYRYVGVPSWTGENDGQFLDGYPATLTVVGTQPATRVTVELPDDVSVQPGPGIQINGQTVTATVDRDEVLTLLSDLPTIRRGQPLGVDLTGARITSDLPVAVFSGHVCTFYPETQGACDHLEEQLFPVDTWGARFVLAPPVIRTQTPAAATEAIFWKIVAQRADTRIDFSVPYDALDPRRPGFNGVPECGERKEDDDTIVLGAGEFCEFGTRSPVSIQADGPIQVMGIISGQDSTGVFSALGGHAGDPAIFLVPPERQYRQSYDFLTPTTYFVDYLTVVVPAGGTIELDGEAVDLTGAIPVPGTNKVYAHLEIDDGAHTVSGDRAFGILVYAFDDWVSYAFTGGLNLNKQ